MKFKLSELKDIIQKEYKHTLTKRGADTFDATYAEEPGEDDDTEGEAKPGDLVDHTLREDTFDKEIEDLKKNIKNDEEHIEDLKKDIEGNKEELDRAEKRKDAEEVLDETRGSKGHEKRRRHGHQTGEGPKGHYDDYMGTYGEDEDEHSDDDPGEEDYTWRKGDRSSSHPGRRDYQESYRSSIGALRQLIEEEMNNTLNEDSEDAKFKKGFEDEMESAKAADASAQMMGRYGHTPQEITNQALMGGGKAMGIENKDAKASADVLIAKAKQLNLKPYEDTTFEAFKK